LPRSVAELRKRDPRHRRNEQRLQGVPHTTGDRTAPLLTLLVDRATWKGGELETTLRTPFQKLRLSNRATHSKEALKGPAVAEMKKWLPKTNTDPNTVLENSTWA